MGEVHSTNRKYLGMVDVTIKSMREMLKNVGKRMNLCFACVCLCAFAGIFVCLYCICVLVCKYVNVRAFANYLD